MPVLLLLTLGIIEFGRVLAVYSMVSAATREATRYGAAVGTNPSGTPYYLDCAGMRLAGKKAVAPLLTLPDSAFTFSWDDGAIAISGAACDDASSANQNRVVSGDRLLVTVATTYQPLVPLAPIPPLPMTFKSTRTIIKNISSFPQCNDGLDNDADGLIDYPADPGCSSANDNTESVPGAPTVCYTLLTNVSPGGAGSLVPSPLPNCVNDYNDGTTVTLTATANTGYTFSNWSGGASGSTNPTSVTITANTNVVANFTPNCYTLTTNVSPGGSGSVDPSPPQNCPGGWKYGTVVTLTATAGGGYVFTNWSGDVSGGTNPVDVTVDTNKNVTANFIYVGCYTLTTSVSPGGGGSVTPSPASNCAGGKYTGGTVVTLTAWPSVGYGFSSWSGDASGSANPTTITVATDKSVTANFVASCYSLTVTINPAGWGAVSQNPTPNCGGLYGAGSIVSLTASPTAGHFFGSWSGDVSGSSNPASVTMNTNRFVTANFTGQFHVSSITMT
ncbi:MAG: pilus assembly protein, partial [Chloroflexi bacterium]|nr:pilus assembly protein [Chloroflexota bacterium]